MSVSSLESFEQLLLFPLPNDDEELNGVASNQINYFLKKKRKKIKMKKTALEINKNDNKLWMSKHIRVIRLDQLLPDELQYFFQWFLSTFEELKCGGKLEPRKLMKHLDELNIFEDRSQIVMFVNRLNCNKNRPLTLAEVQYALTGCGLRNASQLRSFTLSQMKRDVPGRVKNRPKTTGHRIPKKNFSKKKDGGIASPPKPQMKRTTTRSPLPGGGYLYTCCPDVPIGRPTTAPEWIPQTELPNETARRRSSTAWPSSAEMNGLPLVGQRTISVTKKSLFSNSPEVDEVQSEPKKLETFEAEDKYQQLKTISAKVKKFRDRLLAT